ncbi:MAG TPA: competence/damage-inducible protein A [Bacteroidales bacterium]|jgi:nicotinamide-nucleotide amidase|nr:competence/damage-inducible protein A [Bacteroidales bacterium]HQH25654.1 competence/damage-inducible protein A [Bacteroidales bacterium]HQJ83242.1 competence/damage-inducible protein A [Bacteroidales bacterium]
MKAWIITIGDELLIGQTVDTNSAFIGAELSKAGFDIERKISIHDRRDDILQTFRGINPDVQLLICTGGLGPTSDDITKQTLCEVFDTRLVPDREVLTRVEEMMSRRGFPMNENNRLQAMVPENCRVIPNEMGTAPGMLFEKDAAMFIFMPGVPFEMKHMMTEHVIPILKERFNTQSIIHKNIMTYGAPEALLAEMLSAFESALPEELSLAYLPSSGVIKLRLTASGKDRGMLEKIIGEQVAKLYQKIPDLIYGEDEKPLEKVVGELLAERKQTLSTAESCTGGKIAQMLTSVVGSSAYFMGSVVAYDNSVKRKLLGVPGELLDKHGAVSEEVVTAMAEGVRRVTGTDYSVATSGIAGPDGGSPSKPVGTVWIAVSSDKGTVTEKYVYGSDRHQNILRSSNAALNLLRLQIIRK